MLPELPSESTFDSIDKGKFLFYGCVFTLGVDLILYPLELIKTRVQVEAASKATLLEGSLRVGQDVWRREGVRGLYRGFSMHAIGGLPSQGAYFYGYNWARDKLGRANAGLAPESQFPLFALDAAAGLFADVAAAPLWTPMEVVSTRLQLQGPGVVVNTGAWDATRSIYGAHGVKGLFRGLTASIVAFGPASALWWATYQGCNRWLSGKGVLGQGVWVDAASGFVAGCMSSVITNPLDVAKTRLQAASGLLGEFHLDSKAEEAAGRKAAAAHLAALSRHSRVRHGVGVGGAAGKPHATPATATASATSGGGGGVGGGNSLPLKDRQSLVGARLEMAKKQAWSTSHARLQAVAAVASAALVGGGRVQQQQQPTRPFPSSSPSPFSHTSLLAEIAGSERRLAQRAAHAAARLGGAAGGGGGGGGGGGLRFTPPRAPTTMMGMLLHIVATDGPGALIRGLLPRLIMQGPASAATFVCYEQVMELSKKDIVE